MINWPETVVDPIDVEAYVPERRDIAPAPPEFACKLPGPWQASHPTTGRATLPI
jgi:hypothetical protein